MYHLTFHHNQVNHDLGKCSFESAFQQGNEIMRTPNGIPLRNVDFSRPDAGTFNDLEFYQGLVNRPGSPRVDLASLSVIRNNYILGIRSDYRLTMANGEVYEVTGPAHRFENGPYASCEANGSRTVQTVSLEPGEYLVAVQARQGEILDALQLVTSKGQTHYVGGFGGCFDEVHADSSSEAVVAFSGVRKGVMHGIRYYKVKSDPLPAPTPEPLHMMWMCSVLSWLLPRDSLPLSRYAVDGEPCSICCKPMARREFQRFAIFHCGHAVHWSCLERLRDHGLQQRDHSIPQCPLCRVPIGTQ